MKHTTLIIEDEVNVKFANLELPERKSLVQQFKILDPAARHTPAFRLGRWDGCTQYFTLGGMTYINLLPEVLPYLEQRGYTFDIDDRREYLGQRKLEFTPVTADSFAHVKWHKGHRFEGQPLKFEDHQVAALNRYFENPQCIQELSTGFGKCLAGDTLITVALDPDSPFVQYFGLGATVTVPIARLINWIEEYMHAPLVDNKERSTTGLGIYVDTPTGSALVNYVIKKEMLPTLTVTLDSGYSITVARQHRFHYNGTDIVAEQLTQGSKLDTRDGTASVVSVVASQAQHCYDIAIPAPHLYYDANGLVHHNTAVTAALSSKVETEVDGRTVVIVPNRDLVTQTEKIYKMFELDVGVFFGGRKEYNKTHTICTWQSLMNLIKETKSGSAEFTIHEFLDNVQAVIVDECHQVKGSELRAMLSGAFAHIPLRWGLTGTVHKDKHAWYPLLTCIGHVVGRVKASELQAQGKLANCHIDIMQLQDHAVYGNYQAELKYLVSDKTRLRHIAQQITEIAQTGNTLVLVDRINSGEMLQEMIEGSILVNGSTKSTERHEHYDSMGDLNNVPLIATYGVAAVGIDIPRIFNLVLFEPGKSFVRVIQSIGRGIRVASDKDFVQIWDVTSSCKFSKRHLTARKKFYKEADYPFKVHKIDFLGSNQTWLGTAGNKHDKK